MVFGGGALRSIAVLGLLWVLGSICVQADTRTAWQRGQWFTDYEQGLRQAHRDGRPALLYFDAPWCSWCQLYKRDTLEHAAVRAALRKDFVAIVVDFDARPDLMQRYGGKGLPFTVILSPGGEVLNRFVGMLTPEDMRQMLAQVRDRQNVPEPEPSPGFYQSHGVRSLDRQGYERFRAAFLQHLEWLYDSESETLAGHFPTGAALKRPSPRTWIYLMDHGLWPQRTRRAASVEWRRLSDPVAGGFFNFFDASSGDGEHLETSKLLEVNAWLSAWLAQAGRHDRQVADAARAGWGYLHDVLWDAKWGGFYQAQAADADYYALAPELRRRRPPPPVATVKRADTNAQAAWALLRMARYSGDAQVNDYAVRTVDFVLREMVRDGALFHLWRDGELSLPDLPQNWFWVLAAGAEVERLRPDPRRRRRLNAVAETAGRWLTAQMRAARAERLPAELAGLIAWVAGSRDLYPVIPSKARDWALRQLRIAADTPPDDLVTGLRAWEATLAVTRPTRGQ